MDRPHLRRAEALAIADKLAAALEHLVDTSCPAMAAHYLRATLHARREHLLDPQLCTTAPDLPPEMERMGRPTLSKYASLAVWRHTTHCFNLLSGITDPDFRAAVQTVYFSPFPPNKPPYAWSRSAAKAPNVHQQGGPAHLKKLAKEGAYELLQLQTTERKGWSHRSTLEDEAWLALTQKGVNRTARDVLKLEDHFPIQEKS